MIEDEKTKANNGRRFDDASADELMQKNILDFTYRRQECISDGMKSQFHTLVKKNICFKRVIFIFISSF